MYSKRAWLNDESSPSTGAIAAYEGPSPFREDSEMPYMFLEISDCRGSVRLHKTDIDKTEDFINKLKIVVSETQKFIQYLEGK